jgi:hypothetical protein
MVKDMKGSDCDLIDVSSREFTYYTVSNCRMSGEW